MLKLKLTVIAITLGVNLAPALAQQVPPAPTQQETTIVGLPLYSTDGEKLGEVTQVGMHEEQQAVLLDVARRYIDGEQAVLAEMGTFLGMGPKPVLIPAEMVTRKGDRAELTMRAEEVRKLLSNP